MKHKSLLRLSAPLLIVVMAMGNIACGSKTNDDRDKELEELRQIAEMDRREMENQYADFAAQYGEMKREIHDDSLVSRLDAEQKRAEKLLKELRELKTNSAAEILRLKKELQTVRAVLRDYVRQVDSLQQINQTLTSERDEARAEAERTRRENESVNERNTKLTEQVAVASQLNATSVSIVPQKKNGKAAKRSKDITRFAVTFTLTRNVTAKTGNRKVYIRLLKPTQDVVGRSGTFRYENKDLDFSASRSIEYTGEEQTVSLYVPVSEFLSAGTYSVYIFVDGQMVGSGKTSVAK